MFCQSVELDRRCQAQDMVVGMTSRSLPNQVVESDELNTHAPPELVWLMFRFDQQQKVASVR